MSLRRLHEEKITSPTLMEMFRSNVILENRPIISFKPPIKSPTAISLPKVADNRPAPEPPVNNSPSSPDVMDPESVTSRVNKLFGAPSKVLPVNKAPVKARNPPKCSVCKGLVKGHSGPIGKGKCKNGGPSTSYVETVDMALPTPVQSRDDCITPPPPFEEELSTFRLLSEENDQQSGALVLHRPTILRDLDEIGDLLEVSDNETIEALDTLTRTSFSPEPTESDSHIVKSTKRSFDRKSEVKTQKQNPTKKQKTSGVNYFSGLMKNLYARDDLLATFEIANKKSFNLIQPKTKPQTNSPDHPPLPDNDSPPPEADHQSPLLISDENHPMDNFSPEDEDHFLDTWSPEHHYPGIISHSLNTINPEDHSQDPISPVKLPNPFQLIRRSSAQAQSTKQVPSKSNSKKKSDDEDDIFDFSDHEGALEEVEVHEAPAPVKRRKVRKNWRVPKSGPFWDRLMTRPEDHSQDTINPDDHSQDTINPDDHFHDTINPDDHSQGTNGPKDHSPDKISPENRPEYIHPSDYPTHGKKDFTFDNPSSNRTRGNVTKTRSGKRPPRKCKDKNCENCIIETNCGLCECCLNPGLKLKCVLR